MPGLLFLSDGARCDLYSFPTRRSSDLHGLIGGAGTPLDNYGTVATSVGDANYFDLIDVPFNNYRSLAVQHDTLRLGGVGGNAYTGYAGSTITVAAGTHLVFDGPAALAA